MVNEVKIIVGEKQTIYFSDGTFIEFTIVGNGAISILKTNNSHFLNLNKHNKEIRIKLTGDTYSFNNETIKFI